MPGVMRLSFKLCLPVLALLQASCAGVPGGGRSGFWIDVYRGEPLTYEDMLDDLAESRVIYLGERHTLERHHAIQERIVTDLTQRGVPLVLGLEQMEAFNQAALDRYHQGEIDFDELAEQTEWVKRWSNYEQYRPILEVARQAGAPLRAHSARFGPPVSSGRLHWPHYWSSPATPHANRAPGSSTCPGPLQHSNRLKCRAPTHRASAATATLSPIKPPTISQLCGISLLPSVARLVGSSLRLM